MNPIGSLEVAKTFRFWEVNGTFRILPIQAEKLRNHLLNVYVPKGESCFLGPFGAGQLSSWLISVYMFKLAAISPMEGFS